MTDKSNWTDVENRHHPLPIFITTDVKQSFFDDHHLRVPWNGYYVVTADDYGLCCVISNQMQTGLT